MTLNEIIEVVKGKSNINSEEVINEIKTDTRKIDKKDIFIALKGKNYDGENFIDEAFKKGAISCITESDYKDCIKVDSTTESLFLLGKYIREKYPIPLISITGSNGKTTTKDLLSYVLSSKYNVLYNEGSKNNIIGLSDTLFKLNKDIDIIVMELGTNHLGEIEKLSNMCKINTALITNIGTAHLEYFKTKKNIFKEKTSVKCKNMIVNGDDKYLKKLKCFKCGINKKNDLIAYNIKEYIDHTTFNIFIDKEYKVVFNNPGIHFINDILLVIKCSLDYGIEIDTIIKRIGEFKLTNNRMTVKKINSNTLISDCYNASLESIIAGLEYFKNIKNKKIIILGDILELGKYSKKIHKKINKELKKIHDKDVITVGDVSKYIKSIHYKDVDELIYNFNLDNIDNSYIYVKGSHKINLDKFVDFITK